MQSNPYQYAGRGMSVAQSPESARSEFIRKTYTHLAGAVLAFIAIEATLLSLPIAKSMSETMMGGRYSWLIVLLGAEVSFAEQNVETYEFEPDCLKVSSSFKRLLTLNILNICVKNFVAG